MRATGCANGPAQLKTLAENLDLVFAKMIEQAQGRCYRMHGLDYAFLLGDKNEEAREFLPNLRVALFKVLSSVGAGQSTEEGQGLTFEHFNLDSDFGATAKFVVSYIKNSRKINPSKAPGDGLRLLTEGDLEAVIAAYRKVGAEKFLRKFARSQPICISSDRGYLKPQLTEHYISIDHLRKPFFEGVDLHANEERFVELTKILDSIMLNAFPTLSNAVRGKRFSINVNVQSVFSKAFDNFLEKTPIELMRKLVIEFRQDDAVVNYDGYAIARERLRTKGTHVAIDQIAPSAIGLVNISFLDAQIAKLNWDAGAADDLYSRHDIVEKLLRNGIQPVLSRVDNERGRDVGKDLGIEMYQGFLIDNILKADAGKSAEAVA